MGGNILENFLFCSMLNKTMQRETLQTAFSIVIQRLKLGVINFCHNYPGLMDIPENVIEVLFKSNLEHLALILGVLFYSKEGVEQVERLNGI